MTHAEKEIRNNRIVQQRKDGMSMNQIAEQYGVTLSAVWCICKKNGVGGVMSDRKANPKVYRNQYTNGDFDRIQNAINFCNSCRQQHKDELAREKERRAKEREERKRNNLHMYFTKQFEFKACLCCGTVFTTTKPNNKYCSKECATKISNSISKDKRVKKMRAVLVDRDITLESLYKRDSGKCYICGRTCEWDDHYIKDNGAFISGPNYPSIDHVKPLSKGGKHEWSNVRLACRKCNWEKSNTDASLSA